jgi:amino acid transporter
LSGWLVSYLGFAPLFLGLGATMGNASFSSLGVWFTTSTGIITVSILNAFLSLILLVSGFKNYVKFQHIMWWGTLIAFAVMFVVLFATPPATFVDSLNNFAVASGGAPNFYQTAVDAVTAAGIDLHPPFSLMATLLVAPIAWTSLQWATYSAQQNGEIKDARSFKSQTFIMVGSLVLTGLLLALLALGLERVAGTEFLYVAGAGYWSLIPEATVNGFYLWPNIVAVALTGSPLVVLIIGIGYILNSFQIVCNCYIGMTRIMVAMSLDRLLPAWVSQIHEKWRTPLNAHLVYFLASIPVILAYNMVPGWVGLTLGVTFGCGYVFIVSCLAGALLPYRAKELYEASPGSQYKLGGIPLVTILGIIGSILGTVMVLAFLLSPTLGVLGNWNFADFPANLWAQIIAFAIILVSAGWYFLAKNTQKARGINVEYAFKEIPPE